MVLQLTNFHISHDFHAKLAYLNYIDPCKEAKWLFGQLGGKFCRYGTSDFGDK